MENPKEIYNYVSFSLFAVSQDQIGYMKLLRYAAQFLVKLKTLSKISLESPWHVILFHDARLPPQFFEEARRLTNNTFTDVYMGCSQGLYGTLWRFLVHDRDDVGVYFVNDADETFKKTDIDAMNALTRDASLEAAVCTPIWYHPICKEEHIDKLLVDAGGFGMRPKLLSFSMHRLIAEEFATRRFVYGSDEVFLTRCVHPLINNMITISRTQCFPPIGSNRYGQYFSILSHAPSIALMPNNDVYHGNEHALEPELVSWFRNNDHMGYPAFPNSNTIIKSVRHVIDNEVSLRNTDEYMKQNMLNHIWHGPWMPAIRSYLPNPYLLCVEVHVNGNTCNGQFHQDIGTTPVWNVVVPLGDEGNTSGKCGGTTVFFTDDADGVSISCDFNQYFIFPGHLPHYREASQSQEMAKNRRTLFIQFTNVYRVPAEFLSTSRMLHAKEKSGKRQRKRATIRPLTMQLRRRIV